MKVELPTLHPDQVRAWDLFETNRYLALRCGRRWGKNEFGYTVAGRGMLRGARIGWFAPDYRRLEPVYPRMAKIMADVKVRSNASDRMIQARGGGLLECWTLGDPNAGRGREYDIVIVDEAAFAQPSQGQSVLQIFQASIEPTLLITRGKALVMSNSAGKNPDNFFYQICTESQHGFVEMHAPSRNSPYVPPDEVERLKASRSPLVFAQEYEAEFVDWTGQAFFEEDRMLGADGQPFDGLKIDAIFAIVDTAAKTGKTNDGSGVVYYGLRRRGLPVPRLLILDWEYEQIRGDMLESHLPGVLARCEELARVHRCMGGVVGVWIEDKSTGIVLIQQMEKKSQLFKAIDSGLTSMGKSERAINASPYVYQRQVGFTPTAWNKAVVYKERIKNHLRDQITSFRVGDKEDRDDDLLDCFTYGCMIGLGDSSGF